MDSRFRPSEITDPDRGDKGLAWDDDKTYAKGEKIARQFKIRGIGASDNDHFQDENLPTFVDLPKAEFGSLPASALA